MNIPEEFGKYLLLKKLTEDPLGETFRAGRVGKEGMEQVVLLRVFNGKGVDGEKLGAKVAGRAAVQEALKSPNIGNGVDLGRVRSFPYTAYDYISGKNLAALFAQSARQFSPIPTDHAMLIAERIALALSAAYETRIQDERVLHGFVIPHLVMISNEGETRLLGFEVAPGLRELAASGWQDEAIRPYVSPETFTGAPISRADDVWSLGALLYELLTGERLPASSGSYDAAIDQAMLANDGTPLPAPVAALLKKSLAPREQRIADALTWHKSLSKLMSDGQYSPTTFNLAFFMHNLFREEIERESQEIQAEKNLDVRQHVAAVTAAAAVAAAPAPVAAPALRETTGVREVTLPGTRIQEGGEAASSKKGLFIGLAAAALVAAAVGGWFFLGRSGGGTETQASPEPVPSSTVQTASMPVAPPVEAVPAAQAGPTQEELQAQIQAMFEARSKEMEAKLKTQYDDRIKQLQTQLEDSKRAPAPAPVQQAAATPPPIETRPASRTEAPAVTNPIPAMPNLQPAQPPAKEEREAEKPAAPVPAPVASAPAPAPPRPQPQVQLGDLVQQGPGVTAPRLSSRLDPRYPLAAQRMNRAAQVDIKVLVDEKGRVMDAERVGAKAGFGFDEAALDAARRAVFQPATKDGIRVKMWTTLRVAFKPQS
ncbi:MAG TPA: TonB family protein [Thermoanaerobaculia bacterium]|nr:TonB family protein [Thermoanaerobaculia bacterium]